MPYLYSDEQKQIREEVRRFLAATSTPAKLRELLERPGAYDEAFWNAARQMGWTAMAIAEADGGLGMGLVDSLIVAEECGRALAGAPFLASGFAATHVLAAIGNPDGLLQRVAAGDIITAIAFSEAAEILPREVGTRFSSGQLTGEKTAVLGGAAANVAIVLASDESNAPCLAIADLQAAGVYRKVIETIDNSRGLANLRFEAAPATLLLTNDAMQLAGQSLGRLALFLASEGVGGTDACIALSRDYANQRQAFGQPIGKFQAVKHSIAEIYVLNEMARASVLDAAVRLERGDADADAYIGAARLNAVEAYERAAAATTQIHGGIGVTWEADIHLHYRRSRTLATEAGAQHYWEDRIVEILEAGHDRSA
jgi:acyl-CoA dehydrogenase